MIRNYKFRLFTNANQERELTAALETHRRLYNLALEGIQLCWETAGVSWSFAEQCRWAARYRRTNEYLQRVSVSSCEQTLKRLDCAMRAFFARVKKNQKPGFPRFAGRERFNSFLLRTSHGYGDGWKIVDGKLRLRNIGTVRVRWHRNMPAGKIKNVRIIRDNGKWFAIFCVEIPDAEPVVPGRAVGIDVGLKSFVTTSDGESLGDTRCLERALPELRRRQRALSRCKSGSSRRKLVKSRVTTLHAKVRNVRKDLHHKVARSLVDRYGAIGAESLNIAGMLRNRSLSRRISDAGWGQFVSILSSKAESAGCRVVLVDAKNTSQQCSNCGEIVRKSLAARVHSCACGCVLDRDVNAAINILGRAAPKGAKINSLILS